MDVLGMHRSHVKNIVRYALRRRESGESQRNTGESEMHILRDVRGSTGQTL